MSILLSPGHQHHTRPNRWITDAIAKNKALEAQPKEFEKLTSGVSLMSPGGSILSPKQVAMLAVVGTGVRGRGRMNHRGRRQMSGWLAYRLDLEGEARRA